jgi:uncharacterized protein (PEP-CTERM system associated)
MGFQARPCCPARISSARWKAVVLAGACVSSLGGASAWAQVAGGGSRSTSVSAQVDADVSQVVERRRAGTDSQDTVTQLRPGIRVESRSGRVVGSLAYSLNLAHHTKQDYQGENVQNFLSGSLQAEAIERWMYVDATANVTQQPASAYGRQTASDSTVVNANRIEVGSVSVSPYVRGVVASSVNYELRLTGSATNGRRSKAADSSTTGGNFGLSSAVPGTLFGWALNASTQTVDFRTGRKTQSDRYGARVTWMPDPDLTFNVSGGQEDTDIGSLIKTRYNNWGAGATWRPSPRTRAQFNTEDRYFGRSHQVTLEHRMASSSIQFSSSRDAGNGADPSGTGQRVTLYQAYDRLLANTFPDPVERDAVIRLLLQSQNADPNQLVSSGSINSAITVVQRNQLTFAYSGQRMTTSLQLYTNRSQVIDPTVAAPEADRQWGYLGSVSYRLTPTAQVNMTGSRMVTQSTDTRPGTDLKSLTLGWSDQIARRTSAGVTLRYSVFNSNTDPYRQAAIQASISQRF